jgi:hypothetical protein
MRDEVVGVGTPPLAGIFGEFAFRPRDVGQIARVCVPPFKESLPPLVRLKA